MIMPKYWVLCAAALTLAAQPIITTYAGSDYRFDGDGKKALQAPLGAISDVVIDDQGRVYVSDPNNEMILRFTPNGTLTVIAGNGKRGYTPDGIAATSGALAEPLGLALDSAGNLYFAESGNNVIRKVGADGILTTAAGARGGYLDGPAASAQFSHPVALAFDPAGNLYIVDQGNGRIRKLSADGNVTTIAGTSSGFGFSGDGGLAVNAKFGSYPRGIACDSRGDVYIADTSNNRIRKISNGIIDTFAGNGSNNSASFVDGPAKSVALDTPVGLRFDSIGNLYIAEAGLNKIHKVSTTQNLTTFAGTGSSGFSGDGSSATSATLNVPLGVAIDMSGSLYIADSVNGRVRRVSAAGAISTVAGNGAFGDSGDGGPAVSASFKNPTTIFVDSARNTYILDETGDRVRKIDRSGTITAFAGNGAFGFTGDNGLATNASLNLHSTTNALSGVQGLVADAAGNVYVADAGNGRIRKIGTDATISTFAGGGVSTAEGVKASVAYLGVLSGLGIDTAGNIYYIDEPLIRKISIDGTVRTVAGGGSSVGEGVQATTASIRPGAITVDGPGNIYIADYNNGGARIRKISTAGMISTIAGGSTSGCSGDGGPATSARFSAYIAGLAVSSDGTLYIADSHCEVIRAVSPTGTISAIVGDGNSGFRGDGGPADAASLRTPRGVALDPDGNIYIADTDNLRIRRVLTAPPSFGVSPASLTFSASAGGVAPPAQNLALTSSFSGPSFTVDFSTTDGGVWLAINALSGTLPTVLQVLVDPAGLDPGTYQGVVNVRVAGANPPVRSVTVTLNVSTPLPPSGVVDPISLSYSFGQGAKTTQIRQINLSNAGGGTLTFNAAASTNFGGSWLSISAGTGSVNPNAPVSIGVTADPSNLGPGTYTGQVQIDFSNGGTVRVPVTTTVTTGRQTILLSQTGLTFTAVAGGGLIPPQNFGILNTGQGQMNWTVSSNVLSGSTKWLSVTPPSGVTDASSLVVPLVELDVNQNGLGPGNYYGQVQVVAPGSDNTPQAASVVLNVLPPGSDPGPLIRPTGLIFTTRPGSDPAPQSVVVSNLSATSTSFISGRLSDRPGNLFDHQPVEATVDPADPVTITVSPKLASVDPGVYRGTLTLQFSTGVAQTVGLLFVVAGNNFVVAGNNAKSREAGGCSPTKIVPVFTNLSSGFAATGGWPTAIEAKVVDDCGDPLVDGTVAASFSNGDPPLSLASLKDGRWTGTWLTQNSTQSQVTVTLKASNGGLTGTAQVTLGVQGSAVVPAVTPGGVVGGASFAMGQPLAPGSFISIFGTHLTNLPNRSPGLPYNTQLGATAALIAGRPLPLQSVTESQINAIIPYDVPVNTTLQLIVINGSSISVPQPVIIAAAQPGVFTNDMTGKGAGVVVGTRADNSTYQVDASHPLSPGDVATIYCAGLGAVNPPVTAGTAAPFASLSSASNQVTVTMGGLPAPVSFAGLAPGYAGLYQVNAQVPTGIAPGTNVPLVLTAAGQQSPPVVIAIAAK
jgi:uncharacterized protein (TIGR03437 family)